MAAYGSLIALTNLIERIREYNARNPVFDEQHLMQLKSLEAKAFFLQNFLETYSNGGRREGEALEGRIAVVILDAQDLIESRIVCLIHAQYSHVFDEYDSQDDEYESQDCVILSHICDDILAICVTGLKVDTNGHFSKVLQDVIEVVDLIEKEASEIAQSASMRDEQPRHLTSVGLDKPAPAAHEKDHVMIFGDRLSQLMDKLITTRPVALQTIPITGMGGIGKTTLARTVFDNPRTLKHFDIRSWVTVSQQFDAQAVLFGLVSEIEFEKCGGDKEQKREIQQKLKQLDCSKLGEKLHKHLWRRRYLVVLDDVWSVDAWDKIKIYLSADNNNGSRVIVTTRLANFAIMVASSHNFEMNLLDESESWSLLKEKVFRTESCPPEIEQIGKQIAKNCKGLPLSIAVIGGLLATSLDQQSWKSIAEDVNDSEVNNHCLEILYTSYLHLPIHLKPCFLYFGAFAEDSNIKVSDLMYRWVARGFLKPREGKTLEEIGYDYLKDLAERNLILVSKFTFMRKMKFCKIHDLLRDLCLREVEENRFLSQRFLRDHHSREGEYCFPECDYDLPSSPQNDQAHSAKRGHNRNSLFDLKPLRVVNYNAEHGFYDRRCAINVRYFQKSDVTAMDVKLSWNIQTLIGEDVELPSEIWYNPQLRHLIGRQNLIIDNPCNGRRDLEDNIVLKNLQTICWVNNFRCSEEILGKIPNLKKLGVKYDDEGIEKVSSQHLQNLGRLTKLETLWLFAFPPYFREVQYNLEFSQSIRKLDLSLNYFDWEEMGKKIGSLPHLQKLILEYRDGGEEWNSIEGEFPSLRYLFIYGNLVRWTTDGASLQCLEHLVLVGMEKMEEIPAEIGEIDTLQSIQLYGKYNSDGVIRSAKDILSQQRRWGNEHLHLHISDRFYGHRYEIKEDMFTDASETEEEEQVESDDEELVESEIEEQVESEEEEEEE